MSRPGTVPWLAAHELRLGFRDWLSLMTAGRRRKLRNVIIALGVFGVVMHLVAWPMVERYADARPDLPTLVIVSGILLLSFSLLLSQAMESVTRAFYARADLDLILTAPVAPQKVFAVRIGRIAVALAAQAQALARALVKDLGLWGGALNACYRTRNAHERGLAWRPCLGFRAGRISGQGIRYDVNSTASQAWFALAASANLELPLSARLRLVSGVLLWVPFARHEFSVQGRGAAFETSPFAGTLQLGLELTIG